MKSLAFGFVVVPNFSLIALSACVDPLRIANHVLKQTRYQSLRLLCAALPVFLLAPVWVAIPLAFNHEPYFHSPIRAYSLRWFADLFGNPVWLSAITNSLVTVLLVLSTVNATLAGFDMGLLRAARSLGASPVVAFRRVMLPIVWPGVLSGALFAFATSFDEVVVVLFLGGPGQTTLPRQMWSGLREQLSPTILAAAFVLIIFAIALLLTLEMLRRRSVALRGLGEG